MGKYDINFSVKEKNTTYLTHGIHPYPAKFPPQLPKQIIEKYATKGTTLLDPFCGSGTTNVEAKLYGIDSIGIDINGLATLLTEVKTTTLTIDQLNIVEEFGRKIESAIFNWAFQRPELEPKEIEAREHWFQQNVAEEITYILQCIEKITSEVVRNFLRIVLSSIIVKVSNQESDTRFVAKEKNIADLTTLKLFNGRLSDYTLRMQQYSKVATNAARVKVYNADSRNIDFIRDESIGLLITSPPYANTYDYYLYHKSRKRWLDIDVKFAQYNEIGSRREYSSLKENALKWEQDLKACFKEMNRVMQKESHAFIVIGDSVIRRKIIHINNVIENFVDEVGLQIMKIISTDLSKHSKLFNPSFASAGKKEHLIILRKKS